MTQSPHNSNPARPLRVLFVCIGNSCRSQMAEALANHLGKGKVQAYSAGSHPYGRIVPETHEVLQEKGISLEGHSSKGLREVPVADMDFVVGMGREVECPLPAGFKGQVIEWNIPDPFAFDLEYYRNVRDLIEQQVKALLDDLTMRKSKASPASPPPKT